MAVCNQPQPTSLTQSGHLILGMVGTMSTIMWCTNPVSTGRATETDQRRPTGPLPW